MCAKARGRHWVPGCATLCLLHVRQCLLLNLCLLVLARLAGQQAPGISLCSPPPQRSWCRYWRQCSACMLVLRIQSRGVAPDQQGLSQPLSNLCSWERHPNLFAPGAAAAAASAVALAFGASLPLFLVFPSSQFPQVHRHLENYKAN